MKENEALQKAVQDAIRWEPLLSAAEIDVIAKDGVVTLSGIVDSFAKKQEAENAAKMVSGVKVVVENIDINFGGWLERGDTEIAGEVLNAFKWNSQFPHDKVKITVEHGWVTLGGKLTWNYQREAASKLVSSLLGVTGVTNSIVIETASAREVEQVEIENALGRNWAIDNKRIKVKVSGNNVTLHGKVHSFYQKDEAGRIAWKAPGVCSVDNALVIEYN